MKNEEKQKYLDILYEVLEDCKNDLDNINLDIIYDKFDDLLTSKQI